MLSKGVAHCAMWPLPPQINYGPQQDTTLHQRQHQHSTPSIHINAQSRATSGNIFETEACRNVWLHLLQNWVCSCAVIFAMIFGDHLDFLFSVWVRHQSVYENVQEYEMFNFLIIIEWVITDQWSWSQSAVAMRCTLYRYSEVALDTRVRLCHESSSL